MLVPPPGEQCRLPGFLPLCHTAASDIQEHIWKKEREREKWGGGRVRVRVKERAEGQKRKFDGK